MDSLSAVLWILEFAHRALQATVNVLRRAGRAAGRLFGRGSSDRADPRRDVSERGDSGRRDV